MERFNEETRKQWLQEIEVFIKTEFPDGVFAEYLKDFYFWKVQETPPWVHIGISIQALIDCTPGTTGDEITVSKGVSGI